MKKTQFNRFFIALLACCIIFSTPACTSDAKSSTIPHQKATKPCIFCQIINKESPAVVLYEDATVIAIEKRPVRKPVSCLIIPKKHVVNLNDLDMNNAQDCKLICHIMEVAQMLAKRLDGNQSFRLMNNNGPTQQSVFHMHWHFISKNNWAKPQKGSV